MSSTPVISCSSGEATASASTCGLAPGYCAVTTTVGGATSGYSAIGSTRAETRPAISSSTESTPAKIGRSMKKWVSFMGSSLLVSGRAARSGVVGPRV